MPLPNNELQERYVGIRRNLVPAVKTYVAVTDPREVARQASAVTQFILKEPELAGLRQAGSGDPFFNLSYGIDIGVILGTRLTQKRLENEVICPTCKDAVVDLIAAAREIVTNKRRPIGYPDTSILEAALAILDQTHDDVDLDVVGGA